MSRFRTSAVSIAIVSMVALSACVARPTDSVGASAVPAASIGASPTPTSSPEPATSAPTPTRTPTPFVAPSDPELFARLPSEVRGIELMRFVVPGNTFVRGGDVCSFICPDEVPSFVEALDISADDVSVGVAYDEMIVENPPAPGMLVAWVVAFRARGVEESSLVEARVVNLPQLDVPPQTLSSGGKSVVRIWYSFGAQYLYAHEDTLYVIYGEDGRAPDDFASWRADSPIPADVAAMVAALP